MKRTFEQMTMGLKHLAIRLTSNAADLIYPPACAFCSVALASQQAGGEARAALCSECRADFAQDLRGACLRCGYPIGQFISTDSGCIHCSRRHFRFKSLLRLGVYNNELRHACIRGKSAGAESLSAALGAYFCETHLEQLRTLGLDIVVPVPQHWLHRLTRPHHQANTIAESIAARLRLPYQQHALKKLRLTQDQSSLPKALRLENLNKAFRTSRRASVAGKTVLLVDDICTTGTTANECARALRQGGAKAVHVAVIAIVEAPQ